MSVATLEQLRRPRTKRVTVRVDDEPTEFVVQKIKVGQQRRLQAECVDEYGTVDTDKLYALTAQMCVVEPALSDEDVDLIDGDVFAALSILIAQHSGVADAEKLITSPASEEGAGIVKEFPASSGDPED